MVPSLDEDTESDDAGLRPLKALRIVPVARLIGGIRGILGSKFIVPEQKESVVVPDSSMTPPSSFAGSLSVDPNSVLILEGARGSSGGSFQPGKPSPVGRLVGIPYYRKIFPPRSGSVVTPLFMGLSFMLK